jgi:hypothetical protein
MNSTNSNSTSKTLTKNARPRKSKTLTPEDAKTKTFIVKREIKKIITWEMNYGAFIQYWMNEDEQKEGETDEAFETRRMRAWANLVDECKFGYDLEDEIEDEDTLGWDDLTYEDEFNNIVQEHMKPE